MLAFINLANIYDIYVLSINKYLNVLMFFINHNISDHYCELSVSFEVVVS